MRTVSRSSLCALAFIGAATLACGAQSGPAERQIRAMPGQEVRIGIYADIQPDCTSGKLPALRLVAAPAHGAVNVKRGTLKATNFKQCLATEVPALVVLYRAPKEFSGTETFELEIAYPTGRKQRQQFRVTVSSSPDARGI